MGGSFLQQLGRSNQAPSPRVSLWITNLPVCNCSFFGRLCGSGPRDVIWSIRVPSPWEPQPRSPRCVHPRGKAGPFLRKSSLSKHWISFKKEAHVFSRTGFIVFVIVLYLFQSSSVKTLCTLTFPAIGMSAVPSFKHFIIFFL